MKIGALIQAVILWMVAVSVLAVDDVEHRVGHHYWTRPALSETSVEFHLDVKLRKRLAISDKRRFRIVGIEIGGPWPPSDPIYRVAFEDGVIGYMDAREFEHRLFIEPRANQVPSSPILKPPLGQGIHVYQFERSSIFVADPDVMWERLRNQGPRFFRPGNVPVEPPSSVLESPTAPIIGPR